MNSPKGASPFLFSIAGAALLAVTSVSTPNHAAAATAATTAAEVTAPSPLSNKKFEDSHTLTDAKLKAEAGSLSQFSARASLSYYGPTLGNLSDPEQPNPDGTVGNYSQALKGSVSMRYRLSPDSTISGGSGISFIRPFHGWTRTDANNPFISYDFSNRFGRLQMRNSAKVTASTIPNYTAIGQFGGVSWDNSLIYNLGRSGLAFSFDTTFDYWLFHRPHRPGSPRNGGDGRASQYMLSWYPGLKYNVNDKLSFNTSAGFSLYNPRGSSDPFHLLNRTASLRLGMGYAITRDIYFAPYLQSFVTQLTLDMTTVNVSGVFSVF
ncbi:MAG: hypothetical protein RBT63_04305 [Bdellovibrionales bacterium]|jgi:hypothetical protein|nr:hypothetical protein [Bdellovibrionales bacterium]